MSVHVLVWERGTLVSLDHKCSWGSFWINFIRFVWRLGRLHFFREIKDPIGRNQRPNRTQKDPYPYPTGGDHNRALNRNDPSAMPRIHHGIRKGSSSWTETIPRRCNASTMESEKVLNRNDPSAMQCINHGIRKGPTARISSGKEFKRARAVGCLLSLTLFLGKTFPSKDFQA